MDYGELLWLVEKWKGQYMCVCRCWSVCCEVKGSVYVCMQMLVSVLWSERVSICVYADVGQCVVKWKGQYMCVCRCWSVLLWNERVSICVYADVGQCVVKSKGQYMCVCRCWSVCCEVKGSVYVCMQMLVSVLWSQRVSICVYADVGQCVVKWKGQYMCVCRCWSVCCEVKGSVYVCMQMLVSVLWSQRVSICVYADVGQCYCEAL